MTEEQYTELSKKFQEIELLDTDGAKNIRRIYNSVESIYFDISQYAKGYSGQRISAQLKELNALLNLKISRALIDDGDWDPEQNPVRPTVTEKDIIPYVPQDDPQPKPPVINPQPQQPSDPEPNNIGLIVGLSVGGAALVAAAVGVSVVLARKKLKQK